MAFGYASVERIQSFLFNEGEVVLVELGRLGFRGLLEDLTDIFDLVVVFGYSGGSLVEDVCILLHTEHGD